MFGDSILEALGPQPGNELAKRRGYVSPVMARFYVTLREVRMLNNAREAELDDDGGHDV
jgi:hypothetical protein